MSLYTFAAASLTTIDDYERQPVVSRGMVMRTLTLCLAFGAALVALQQGHSPF